VARQTILNGGLEGVTARGKLDPFLKQEAAMARVFQQAGQGLKRHIPAEALDDGAVAIADHGQGGNMRVEQAGRLVFVELKPSAGDLDAKRH